VFEEQEDVAAEALRLRLAERGEQRWGILQGSVEHGQVNAAVVGAQHGEQGHVVLKSLPEQGPILHAGIVGAERCMEGVEGSGEASEFSVELGGQCSQCATS